MSPLGTTALVTGASSGIGETYARALAARGHDLVLVARSGDRLRDVARAIEARGRSAEVLVADLTDRAGLDRVAARLAAPDIALFVNNAGMAVSGPIASMDPDALAALTMLNVLAPTLLARAAAAAMLGRGQGGIINIASVVALTSEAPGISIGYTASKAFMLAMSEGLAHELGPSGIRVQAVLPGITRTAIWDRSGIDVAGFPPDLVMEVEDMVAAAMAGFDLGETVTIPALPDAADWEAFRAARRALWPNLSRRDPGARYEPAPA